MRKIILTSVVLSSLALPMGAQAAEPPPPLTGNFGIFSNYIFRGVTQTSEKPAIQGGFDYAHIGGAKGHEGPTGSYAGIWGSNVSWLSDGAYAVGSSLELDLYGGYKGSFGKSDFGYDLGAIVYYYPGNNLPGTAIANTAEVYVGASWKWLSAKLFYATSNYFATPNSKGTYYVDVSANVPIGKTGITVLTHVGYLMVDGTSVALGASNDSAFGYTDWKLGLSYALPKDFVVGAFYTNTNAEKANYFYLNREWSVGQYAVYVQKTF